MQYLVLKAERIVRTLIGRGERLAVSESSTGGMIASALLSVPGASGCFVAGAIPYTRKAREELLGISEAEMEGMRSASPAYAMMVARRLRSRFDVDWGIVETGATGPAGNRYGDPAGHCCLAVSGVREVEQMLRTGHADRVTNMRLFAAGMLDLFIETIEG